MFYHALHKQTYTLFLCSERTFHSHAAFITVYVCVRCILPIMAILIIWHTDTCAPIYTSGSMSLGLTCGVLAPDVSSWHYWRHMLHFHCCVYVCAILCVCTLALSISSSVCVCLIAFVFSFPVLVAFPLPSFTILLLSFWFFHNSLLSTCEYFLNKQCLSTFKHQGQCCCIKEYCLAQLPAALCSNSPLGGEKRKACIISTYVDICVHFAISRSLL